MLISGVNLTLLLCHYIAFELHSCVLRRAVQLDCDAENLCQIVGEFFLQFVCVCVCMWESLVNFDSLNYYLQLIIFWLIY